jgi:hypothetical protein
VKVSDTTLRWIKRLKGSLEHSAATSYTIDQAILAAIAWMDFELAKEAHEIDKNTKFKDYLITMTDNLDLAYPDVLIEAMARLGA